MSLTQRQRMFLEKLLDVYHDHPGELVHYSDVASALGVANSTAYEMMRLLERKGYVVSEYHLGDHHTGPGRTQVLFRPALKAFKTFRRLVDESVAGDEWSVVRDSVLKRLATHGLPYDDDFLADVLATLPDSSDPLAYCAQVLAASLVSLRGQVTSRVQQLGILRDIADGKGGLDLLGLVPGFALGFLSALRDGSTRLSVLAGHVRRYQTCLQGMDETARGKLLRFSREIVEALRFPVKAT